MLGWTDIPLSRTGQSEALAQSKRLAIQGIQQIVSSDLKRCQATARIVAENIGGLGQARIPVAVEAGWRELNFGQWDGLPSRAIAPDALNQFYADPDQNPPPNGERWRDLKARVGEALQVLEPQPTLVVAHGGSMRAALSILLGWNLDQCWAIDLPCAVLVRLQVWETLPRTAQLTGLFRVEDWP